MGLKTSSISVLGIMHRDDRENEPSLNGVMSEPDVRYSDDSVPTHCADLIWNRETLTPIPVVIYFNAHSFMHTDRKRARELCEIIAKRDKFIVNAEFRNLRKDTTVKDQLSDVATLLMWLQDNAEKYGLDLNNVTAVGSAYGALMAVWTAMFLNGTRLAEASGFPRPSFRIRGLGLLTGMTDTESGDLSMRSIAESIRKVGKTDKNLAECLCPWSNHDLRVLPPVFQVTSDSDSALPDTARMEKLLEINGVPCETITFDASSRTMKGFMEPNASNNECARSLSRMFRYFDNNQ